MNNGGVGQASFDDWMPEAFTGTPVRSSLIDLGCGYRAPAVQQATGVTYRQLDYWARTALVEPSIRDAAGSGSQRLYSFADIVAVRVIKRLLDAGVSLQNVRVAVECLRGRGVDDLAAVTLVCDGASVYECTTDDQIIDLLRGGQGVFGIAIGHTTTDIAAAVVGLPSVKPPVAIQNSANNALIVDELATRRSA